MEGPSLVILKEELRPYLKKKVLSVSGNSKQPIHEIEGKTLNRIETWGKTIFLIFSGNIVTRTHFMLFGSYRINDPKSDRVPRLQLDFPNGKVYFYACAFSIVTADVLKELDHRIDVLSNEWDEAFVKKHIADKGDPYLCDLLLDQTLFAGAGNIVKNEVLFNLRRHPLTKLSAIDPQDLKKLVHAVRTYCEHFYDWKKKFELRKHWQVYKRRKCKVCDRTLKHQDLGRGKRSTFFCPHCQRKALSEERLVVHDVLPVAGGGPKEQRLDH